ncbi:MAG TPA: response regulator [Rectinemataceae bacterium]|nr:response regulator [Rectinemataceae bacterium]
MKRKVLIAEDEFLPATHLRLALSRAGYEVVGSVATGPDCVEAARNSSPDVILLDIRLAGDMDGIEAARLIRQFSTASIVFMSGYQETSFRERAMETSPLAFLVKPILLKDIEDILAKEDGRAQGVLS